MNVESLKTRELGSRVFLSPARIESLRFKLGPKDSSIVLIT
jgi:hypothetical protein